MSNYAVPGLSGAASGALSGAALGSIVPGIGTAVGAIGGGILGLGSSLLSTFNTEDQTKQMQDMINQNYQKIINAINNEYTQGQAGIGATYSAGQKVANARTQAMLGGQGLAGSPIAAAINSEWGSNAAIGAAGQEAQLARQKAQETAQATANQGEQNQQLQYGNLQAENQQFNNAMDSWKSVGSMLSNIMKQPGNSGAGSGSYAGGSGAVNAMGYNAGQDFANSTAVQNLNNLGVSLGNL